MQGTKDEVLGFLKDKGINVKDALGKARAVLNNPFAKMAIKAKGGNIEEIKRAIDVLAGDATATTVKSNFERL